MAAQLSAGFGRDWNSDGPIGRGFRSRRSFSRTVGPAESRDIRLLSELSESLNATDSITKVF